MFYNSDNIKVAFSGLIIKSREFKDKFEINHYILDLKFGEFYFIIGKNDLFANINDLTRVAEEMVNVKTEIIEV